MRSCEDMELLINLSLDDMLPSDEMDTLRAHLETCPACRERFVHLREMKAALADLEEPVPEGLHERIMAYVADNTAETTTENEAPAKILRPRRWHRAVAAAAACAVIAVAAARFVPDLQSHTAESLVAEPQSPGVAYDSVVAESAEDTNNSLLSDTASKAPAATDSQEISQAMTPSLTLPEQAMTDQQTGQMAEDLPPLRQENGEAEFRKEASICKWLKAEGERSKLPQWVDEEFVYETELDGQTVPYVEIAAWAEEYWSDQLLACGFTVEEMEGQDLTENGEYLLLFFFWTE